MSCKENKNGVHSNYCKRVGLFNANFSLDHFAFSSRKLLYCSHSEVKHVAEINRLQHRYKKGLIAEWAVLLAREREFNGSNPWGRMSYMSTISPDVSRRFFFSFLMSGASWCNRIEWTIALVSILCWMKCICLEIENTFVLLFINFGMAFVFLVLFFSETIGNCFFLSCLEIICWHDIIFTMVIWHVLIAIVPLIMLCKIL